MSDRIAVFKALWQEGPDALALIENGRVVDANDRFTRWTSGTPGSELAALLAAIPGSDNHMLVGDGTGQRTLERTIVPVDGTQSLLRLRDVTEARSLRNELDQKRAALEESLNGYDIVDASGRIVYANRAYLQMWGYDTLEDVIGSSPADHCADPDTPGKIIAALERDGHTTLEFEALRKDGSTFDVLMAAHVSRDASGNKLYVGTSLDMSEIKRLQEEVFHKQKLESIGVLAASVAHDFNNMLSPILGFAELMQADDTLSACNRGFLEQIRTAAEHSRELTAKLLAVSRRQVLEPRPTELGDAVAEVAGFLRRTLREDIGLEIHRGVEPCRVMVDPSQLQQVILNLANNAQDAMPNGGTLTIEVGLREFDEAYCREHMRTGPGQFGELVVSDTGEGMTAEARERSFEPFFTTKGRLGTGLGLASVHGIVKQHGGDIWLYSEPGVGTSFKVYWPLTDQPLEPATRPALPTMANQGGVVLVVEDNDLVRRLAQGVLAAAGFDVHVASCGAEARAWLASSDAPLDLLLTDVIMPDTNGRKLAEVAETHHAGLRVLYMSGYTDNVVVHNGFLDGDVDFLRKPFSASELLERVRRALT